MAVDSRDKRMSLLGFGLGPSVQPQVVPNPDGTIGTQDRAHFAHLYAGLALDAPPAAPAFFRSRSLFASAGLLGGLI